MRLNKYIFFVLLNIVTNPIFAADSNKFEIVGSVDGIGISTGTIVIDESVYKLHPKISIDYSEFAVGTAVKCKSIDGWITEIKLLSKSY